MTENERHTYYRAVPGSRELTTSSAADAELRAIEEAVEELAAQRLYEGQWLGGARFEEGLLVPAAVFDRLAPEQSALEQAAYFHLFRLSYGEGKNWCRVGKRELMRRLRVSERRLNVVLDGLVSKGHAKPLHRSVHGTLYRVYLPSEIFHTEIEPGLITGEKLHPLPPEPGPRAIPPADSPAKPITAPSVVPPIVPPVFNRRPSSSSALRERPLESPLNEERFADLSGRKPQGPGLSEMVDSFFAARSRKPKPAERQLALTVLTGLLEDGFSRPEVHHALTWFIRNHPSEKSLERLPYFITKALEEAPQDE
jgi:hypothetical protein